MPAFTSYTLPHPCLILALMADNREERSRVERMCGRWMEGWMKGWMDVSAVVVHTALHILLFSFGSLLLPVVGLNKMGPKRRERRWRSLHQSFAVFPGSTLFARNVTVAKSSLPETDRASGGLKDVYTCLSLCEPKGI